MAVTYYALLTTIGAGKLANASALGTTLKITQLAVGDGGGNVPTPDASRTALVNEVRRAPLNQLSVDPNNAAQIIAEQVIPEDVGGWWIREMGLYDDSGALIAYANCAPSYKPQLAEGSGRTQTVRVVLIVSNAASVELKIDPSVVLATREYVDSAIVSAMNKLDQKQSVRAATTANITLSGLQTLDGVALAAGDRVLVKNQSNAPDNGIYVAASGAWKRTGDADESAEVTPNLTVAVEQGSAQADSIWQLISNAPIVLGTTALVFQNITTGLAPLASPVFTGNPTAPTAAQFDSDTSLATTEFVQRALGSFSSTRGTQAAVQLTASDCGKVVALGGESSYTVTLPDPSEVSVGSTIAFHCRAIVPITISSKAGSQISPEGNIVSAIKLLPGESAVLVRDGGIWSLMGVAGFKYSFGFQGVLSSSGYQRLPSGLIIQWGSTVVSQANTWVVVNLPVSFNNGSAFQVICSPAAVGQTAGGSGVNKSQVQVACSLAGGTVYWLAMGA